MARRGLRSSINNAIDMAFREQLKAAMQRKFGIEIETHANIFTLTLVSERVDGEDFAEAELAYIQAFEAGYLAAWDIANKALVDRERER